MTLFLILTVLMISSISFGSSITVLSNTSYKNFNVYIGIYLDLIIMCLSFMTLINKYGV